MGEGSNVTLLILNFNMSWLGVLTPFFLHRSLHLFSSSLKRLSLAVFKGFGFTLHRWGLALGWPSSIQLRLHF